MQIALVNWIKEHGQGKIAQILGVNRATVYHWEKEMTLPRPHVMVEIEKESKGQVTVDKMVKQYCRKK